MTFEMFFESFGEFDWLAVLVGTAVFVAVSALWYGLLFRAAWSKASGLPSDPPPVTKMIGQALIGFFVNIGLHFTVAGPSSFEHALVAGGVVVGLYFLAAIAYVAVLWRDYPVRAWLIDASWAFTAATLSTWAQGLMM
jgi:hypothetical protein